MFKVQYLSKRGNLWMTKGTYGNEQSAISNAKQSLKSSYIRTVRVKDKQNNIVWIDNNET